MSLLEEKLPWSIQRQSCWAWVFFFFFLGYSKFHVPAWKQFYKVFKVLQNK